MSAPREQGHEDRIGELIREVSDHLQFNLDAYGKVWTGEDEDTRFVCGPLVREVERLREALRAIANQDSVENALDPQWAARIAEAALEASSEPRP